MTLILSYIVIAAYYGAIALLCLFSFHRYQLLYLYFKYKPCRVAEPAPPDEWPAVTVQLPIYNEQFVAERLIQSVGRLEYPREKLQIQVLDDSNDTTCNIAWQACEALKASGVAVDYIHRQNRAGFKAGALENGLRTATGDFIAIFDADFLPYPQYLQQVIPYFSSPQIGMVQTRWDHLNRRASLLTQSQSLMLDGHFVIEHAARNWSGRFFNFNGTAGVWRRAAIEDAGGWQHDTLTEDMDLSYRAQLRGWKFRYVPQIAVPGELPPDMNSFKSQQHRWTKGSIQTCVKHLRPVWQSQQPLKVKAEATFHLCNNFAYLLLLCLCLLMLPVMLIRRDLSFGLPLWLDLVLFTGAVMSMGSFYITSQREIMRGWAQQIKYLPMMVCLGIGLCANNSRAVVEAMLGVRSEFVRTPKFAVLGTNRLGVPASSYVKRKGFVAALELLMAFYYLGIITYCVARGDYLTIPFMMLFHVGFGYVGIMSLVGAREAKLRSNLVPVAS